LGPAGSDVAGRASRFPAAHARVSFDWKEVEMYIGIGTLLLIIILLIILL
jgi:hypothetical protein